ncbi:MAG: tRNA (N6-isopentenyl adenosine(37)-C2)-methylthiotransferase MiaB [Hyphomicrobiales bacterium]|nr:tRNA (N6-isopentenyl adenosine(37)-C2)-methylthiotransferase MiaB [Hyphomicrobiales bacterium]
MQPTRRIIVTSPRAAEAEPGRELTQGTGGSDKTAGGFVKSFGCQMNVYDSSRISGMLGEAGYTAQQGPDGAEVIVLNTCHIREKASDKVFSELGQIRALKEARAARGMSTFVGVAGCVAQAEGAEILKRERTVDFVVGPQSYHRLPEMLARARLGERSLAIEFETQEKFDGLRQRGAAPPLRLISAFLTIQEGCDKFCAFCVVPYTRGAEVSRAPEDIVHEAEQLVAAGVKDISLLGQNVNAYRCETGGKRWGLASLFERLSEITGLERLRYTTSHPNDMSEDLIAAHRDLPKVMPFLHLPVQSGSDAILSAMNRKHTAGAYCGLIERVRRARPDIALSSDFIVGFPGETDADFRATLDLVREVGFASAFSFAYSMRAGTPGAERRDQVASDIKKARLLELQGLLEEQKKTFNASFVGRNCEVLFERRGRHSGQIVGRTPQMLSVQVDGPESLIGSIHDVVIERPGANSLFGRLASERQINEAAN